MRYQLVDTQKPNHSNCGHSNRMKYIFSLVVFIGAAVLVVALTIVLTSTATHDADNDGAHQSCALRKYPNGYVCVCNATYCDQLNIPRPTVEGEYLLVSSSESGARFQTERGQFRPSSSRSIFKYDLFGSDARSMRQRDGETKAKATNCVLKMNPLKTYQKIVGFGGAFTGSVSGLIDAMPDALQKTVFRDYYSIDDGIGYSMMRIPIGGCDFDLRPWAYNEFPLNDVDLSNFTQLDERDLRKVKQIHEIIESTKNPSIKFVGAAWSPPKWMKSNNDWTGRSSLLPQYYSTWAKYHLKFLEYMAASNIKFWAISTGNEPLNGKFASIFVHFMSLGWTAEEQGKWLNDHLHPMLADSDMHDVKLLIGDDQRYTLPWWPERMNKATNNNVMKYVAGIGVHWYWDRFVPPTLLDRTHEDFPDHFILTTESCIGDKPGETHGPLLGSWSRAEQYATYMIQNLNHWSVGWIDWNLVLNEQGGPSYVDNFVDAPIIVNTTTSEEIYKQPSYYVIGHFSKFVRPDCVRIDASVNCGSVLFVAFSCPDRTVTVVLYNKAKTAINLTYKDERNGSSIELFLMPKSINTLVYH